ncbi:unknown; predicted coding region [Mycoplasmopsis pulmonis]|uniref:Uncharacterized protein n=1 Tax=Mycoplasmopsis pulmonis (strain UAB CTIP) TaxID=272635 RepID=Q98R74_MYCPU|nr:hypothetical protein [Mycoplasmopsis pulmonis]CAC13309.1 unknown; predicted coding region [Mycoplasmopsis pulmonis]VEU67900.1 Uncharacterised protein [Mycoplasmopsis pulmonis]
MKLIQVQLLDFELQEIVERIFYKYELMKKEIEKENEFDLIVYSEHLRDIVIFQRFLPDIRNETIYKKNLNRIFLFMAKIKLSKDKNNKEEELAWVKNLQKEVDTLVAYIKIKFDYLKDAQKEFIEAMKNKIEDKIKNSKKDEGDGFIN